MIEVRVLETGDRAEAEDLDSALLAALTIGREARDAMGAVGADPTVHISAPDEGVYITCGIRALERRAEEEGR